MFGRPLGLSDEQFAATVHGDPSDPAWREDHESLLIALADELHDTGTISDPLWSALAPRYADDQLLELIITSGWYRLIACVLNAVGIQREPWAARFPAA